MIFELGGPNIRGIQPENTMTDSEIIDALGGTKLVARLFSIEPASVSGWRKTGIPRARQQTLALLFPGKVPDAWRPSAFDSQDKPAA